MPAIARYQILGELGRGAMGIVYRALDPAIGRELAIKTIRLSDLADQNERMKLRERLFREAQSAGILSHPGIVTIYDVGEEGDVAYIAMECVNGPTLDRLVVADPPDGALVMSILSQTAAALDYAHKRGIVHRDIKPANIMIHDRKTAKITDFGVAKIQSHQMTQAGSMVGTPNYMSPEQIQAQDVDGRSDQFSLAVIAYELLTGEKPFSADSIAALAYRIVREEPAPVHRLNPTVDWPVDTVIRRALSKNPADRYPSCSDFVFALENACRACRKWRPLPAGVAQQMATVAGPAPVHQAATTAPLAVIKEQPEQDRRRPPAALKFLRVFTLVMLGVGLIAALLVGGARYFEQQKELASTQTASTEPPAEKIPKPSAMPQQLPGEEPAKPTEAPQATTAQPDPSAPPPEQPKPEPPRTEQPRPETPAPPAAKKGAGTPAAARLVTNPPGAYLVVDGLSELSCTSPCTLPLTPGRHTLAASLGGFRRTLRILEMPRDNEVFLNMDRASGTMMVRSEPRGATIVVNGTTRSEKTPAMITLPIGNYKVELVYEGQSETHEVQVRDSLMTNVAVTFTPR